MTGLASSWETSSCTEREAEPSEGHNPCQAPPLALSYLTDGVLVQRQDKQGRGPQHQGSLHLQGQWGHDQGTAGLCPRQAPVLMQEALSEGAQEGSEAVRDALATDQEAPRSDQETPLQVCELQTAWQPSGRAGDRARRGDRVRQRVTLVTTAAVKDSSLAPRGPSAGSSVPTGTTPIQLSAAPRSGSTSPTWGHGKERES